MIEIEGLRKSYATPRGRFEALGGVDLSIARGEVFGIIGRSGAGKSTLVSCLNLLDAPDAGSIRIDGQATQGLSEAQLRGARRRIGRVFQGFELLHRRTVFGNVALPLEIAGVAKERIGQKVGRLLEQVGLAALHERYPAQLSGGQKQRVGIARALANDPQVLLSDEATSALDPETTANILALLRDIQRDTGITIVMVTHQMDVVRRICDRVAVLDHGLVVESGGTRELFAAPRHEVTRALVAETTATELSQDSLAALARRIAALRQAQPQHEAQAWRIELGHEGGGNARLAWIAASHGIEIELVQARIEDVQGVAVGLVYALAHGRADALAQARAALAAQVLALPANEAPA